MSETHNGYLKKTSMTTRNVASFIAGAVFGGIFLSTAFAAGLVPAWNRAAVTPVVLVTYDSVNGFRPAGSASSLAPSWTKEEVTPVVETTYNSLAGFVPLRSNTPPSLGPHWTSAQVIPWTEVVYNSLGQFVTKSSE